MKELGNRQTRGEVLERLRNVSPESKPRWGRMTAAEMICHLSDSFRGPLGEKSISPATGALQRSVMKWFALYVPMAWPKNLPTRPEVEQGLGGTPPRQFDQDREELGVLIERFVIGRSGASRMPHPIFGEMTEQEWLRWGYLHADHHLRQFGA